MSELVVSTLNDVATSADAFPPLKSAADGALWVANHVKTTKHDKAEWAALANYIQQAIASISLVASKQGPPFTPAFEAHLRALETAVNTVTTDMQSYLVSKSLIKRVKGHLHFRDRRRIRFYTETMDRALALFNLGNTATGQDVFFHLVEHSSGPHTTVIKAPAPALLEDAPREVVDTTSHKANIELLPYASGAAWNPHHVGLPGTQITLIEDVMSFIRNGRTAPCSQVLVLEGPAGFGKTSLANSVAKACVEADDVTLLSSFFFPKRSTERNPHDLLFTTIARDLASKTGSLALAQAISKAIDGDKSLLSPPLAQQFEHLLLHPIKTVFPPIAATHDSVAPSILEATSVLSIPETVVLTVRDPAAPSTLDTSRPLVVIVDALEEGYSEDLLRVLAEGIPNLPPSFRFVVTCRPSLSLSSTLHSASHHHVVIRKLEQDADYTEDVVSYARHSLARVREARGLESHWPGEDVEDAFAMRAREGGGSFAWVSSICDYLSTRSVNPTGQLEKLVARSPVVASRFADVSGGQGQGLGALYEKLDQRYADVLLDAPWEDEEFVQGYQRVIGGLLCTKEPLDIHSIDIVLGGTGVGGVKAVDVLRPLAPLLKGLDHPGAVVQIAHPSMRDFILHRANTASSKYPQYSKFALDPNATEEALALRMLHLLNTHLPLIYLPSTTPLSTPSPSTPKLLAPDLPHTPQPRSRTNSILTASGLSRPRVMSSGVSFLGANAVPLPPSPPVFLNGAGKRASYAPLSQNTPSSSPSPIRSLSASVGPLLSGNGKGNRPRSPSEAANPTRPPLSLGEAGSSQAMSLSNTTNSSVGPGMQHHHHQHRPSLSSPLSFTSLRVRAGSVAEYHRSSAPKFHFGFNDTDSPSMVWSEEEAIELGYASHHWLDHIFCVKNDEPSEDVLHALATFLKSELLPVGKDGSYVYVESNLMRWMRLIGTGSYDLNQHRSSDSSGADWESDNAPGAQASLGRMEKSLAALTAWCARADFDLWGHADRAHLATYLQALATNLFDPSAAGSAPASETPHSRINRIDKAIDATRCAVTLRRELVRDQPHSHLQNGMGLSIPTSAPPAPSEIHLSALASTLHTLSALLAARGSAHAAHPVHVPASSPTPIMHDESTPAPQSQRQSNPPTSLSQSDSLSTTPFPTLSDSGSIAGVTATTSPTSLPESGTPPLLLSSPGLGLTTQQQKHNDGAEALAAIHEAVTLRRKLAGIWPALFSPSLAESLNAFATRLLEQEGDDAKEEAEMARLEARMLVLSKREAERNSREGTPVVRSRAVSSSSSIFGATSPYAKGLSPSKGSASVTMEASRSMGSSHIPASPAHARTATAPADLTSTPSPSRLPHHPQPGGSPAPSPLLSRRTTKSIGAASSPSSSGTPLPPIPSSPSFPSTFNPRFAFTTRASSIYGSGVQRAFQLALEDHLNPTTNAVQMHGLTPSTTHPVGM